MSTKESEEPRSEGKIELLHHHVARVDGNVFFKRKSLTFWGICMSAFLPRYTLILISVSSAR